jgi:hypothetical protein
MDLYECIVACVGAVCATTVAIVFIIKGME